MHRIRELGPLRLGLVALAAVVALAAGSVLLLRGGEGTEPVGVEGRQSALIDPGSLPGAGWTWVDTPLRRAAAGEAEILSAAPSDEACEPLRTLEGTLAGADAAFATGESRAAERRDGDRLAATVNHTRLSFSDPATLDATTAGLQRALASESIAPCLRQAALANGLETAVERTAPAASAPERGGAHAFEFSVGEGEEAQRMVQHVFWWRDGAALSFLVVATWDDSIELGAVLAAATGARR